MMYTTICKYDIVPGSGAEFKRCIQAEVEPRISCLPGFVGYYLLEVSTDQVVSVSVFDSKGHADIASGPTGFWMRNVLGDYILELPEIVSGQTEVYSSVEARSSRSDCQQVAMECTC
jgi:hypothetical protein